MNDEYVDRLEEYFVNGYANKYSLEDLNKIRDELINQNADTSIIDKSIIVRKKIENNSKESKNNNINIRRVSKLAFISGLLGGLSEKNNSKNNKDLSSWEFQEMLNNGLEESNFEEEIEDEDDFYSDDLD